MKNKYNIRWGIIGCGAVTEVKSGPAYQKTEGFQLAAVMRRNEKLVKDYAKRHNIEKYYTNANDLINDNSIDAIYIATPPDSHKLYGLLVAQAGKICCIEKPLAPSYQDSKEIMEAFEKAKVPLFVSYYRRSLPRFNKVKALLDNGDIGDVRHISWHLNKAANQIDLSQQYNWRTDKSIAPGGYFDDLASHGLDLFAYLLGDYDVVKGIGLNQQKLYSSLDSVSACWAHKNGITGTGSWNFGGCSRQDKVIIYGSKGEITFSIFDEHPIVLSNLIEQKEFYIENPENIQRYHVQNIKEHLCTGNSHPSSGATATHTSWVMDQILRVDS
jgi:1,5-anhydro-D-fructose reductase (1,5-anhydro-D-mannitol-forming)